MATGLQTVINYMIPAVGSPRAYVEYGDFSELRSIDFRNIAGGGIDGQQFNPSGVYIDNTRGTAPLSIKIKAIEYSFACPAGHSLHLPFPAPIDLIAEVSGSDDATVAFTDVPVIPYRSF